MTPFQSFNTASLETQNIKGTIYIQPNSTHLGCHALMTNTGDLWARQGGGDVDTGVMVDDIFFFR